MWSFSIPLHCVVNICLTKHTQLHKQMYVHSTDYELTTEFVQNPVFFLSPIHCKARIDIEHPHVARTTYFCEIVGGMKTLSEVTKCLSPMHL